MKPLAEQSCSACRTGAIKLSDDEAKEKLAQLPQWKIVQVMEQGSPIDHLTRVYNFKNFISALQFTQAVGLLAEEHNHHPAVLTEWGKVTVDWWTHKIKGLHENDFIMAAKTDMLFNAIHL